MKKGKTSEPWQVGVLFSATGNTALIEKTQLAGTLLAIEEINSTGGICNRRLRPVIYDPGSDSAEFGRLAKQLMVEHGISTIFGCYTSSSRKSVLPVVERLNGLLWYPTLYEGFEYSPNIIYTGAAPNQNESVLCRYLMSRYGNRFYFVGSDYIYPKESNRLMRQFLQHYGGTVVGETYVSLGSARREFAPVMSEILNLQPDIIFSTVVGNSTTYLYQAYADAGLNSRTIPIASLTTTETEIQEMGFDVGEHHITAASYFQGVEGESNAEFVRKFKKRCGDDASTNMCAEASYFQVHLFAKALQATGTMDTDVLRKMVMQTDFDAPQGHVSVDAQNGHTSLWSRIGRANSIGQFDIVYESTQQVAADPYLIGYGSAIAKS
jgi:branched-chain amino acid transport system substrate-binding protein